MESINYRAVATALLDLINANYTEDTIQPIQEHYDIAEYLLEKLENIAVDCVIVDENQNEMENPDWNFNEVEDKENHHQRVPIEYKRRVIDYITKNPNHSYTTLRHKFRLLKNKSCIDSWKKHVAIGGTRREMMLTIEKDVFEQFKELRGVLTIVHDEDIRTFALQAAQRYPQFNFKASSSWLAEWKNKFKISSRKVQKLKKFHSSRSDEELDQSVIKFKTEFFEEVSQYDPSKVWNTDQIGFKYEVLSGRTLSFKGEKRTLGSAFSPKNRMTHSYSVQYIISYDGKIIGDAFIVLQEQSGRISERVESNLMCTPNLTISCSKSGKLTTGHVKYFLDKVVKPHATGKILYLLDHWNGQLDMTMYNERFKNDQADMTVKFIPEQTTDVLQPLDTYFNRQLKILVRKMYEHCKIFNPEDYEHMSSRNGILMVQSLTHFLLSSSQFQPMIKHAWVSAGLCNEPVEFLRVSDVCFKFDGKNCQKPTCKNVAFIKCSWCFQTLCHVDLYRNYHVMECPKSPYCN